SLRESLLAPDARCRCKFQSGHFTTGGGHRTFRAPECPIQQEIPMSAHLTLRPGPAEHAPFYAGYVAKVPDGHVVTALVQSAEDAARLLGGLPDQVASFAYAPGKWTLREVVQHCTDAERIFACRALRIGRGDTTELPGW